MKKFVNIETFNDHTISNIVCEQISAVLGIPLTEKRVFRKGKKTQFIINKHFNESQSDEYAKIISQFLLENGIDDFEIDFSTGQISELYETESDIEHNEETPTSVDIFTDTDYDVVNDLLVFMRNDMDFYHNNYYPTMHRIAKNFKKTKHLNMVDPIKSMIQSAILKYCRKYDIPKSPKEMFGSDEISEIVSSVMEEEKIQITNGEYI